MKYHSTSNNFKYSWTEVAQCFWNRYPNPFSTHVTSEDTLWRKIIDGKLITQRLITKVSIVPKWAEIFTPGGSKKVCVLEQSVVDPAEETITTYTRNIGHTRVMVVEEKCVYKPDPTNICSTLCEREAWVNSTLYGFSSAIKTFAMERFRKSIVKSIKGFEYVMNSTYCSENKDQNKLLNLNTEKLKESKEKLKESAQKAKESAKEKLAQKSKTSSIVA